MLQTLCTGCSLKVHLVSGQLAFRRLMNDSCMCAAGATVYIDPAPTVPLNNRETVLGSAEADEEARIVRILSLAVAQNADRIWQVLRSCLPVIYLLKQ